MKAGPRTLKKLFEGGRQFRIPVYQRPYVWTLDQQWEPLWNDVANTARQFAKSLHAASPDPQALAEAEKAALVGSRLNTEMRNSAWPTKQAALKAHSKLILNERLSDYSDWNEESIVDRGIWLATRVSKAWPGPEDAGWDLSEKG